MFGGSTERRSWQCSYTYAHTQHIDLPLHELFFLRSQIQALRLEGIMTEPFAAVAFAQSVTLVRVVCLVVVLSVCSRSTPPLLGLSRSLFDELEPCGGVFANMWVCAFEMGYKMVPLSLPGFQQKFGRGLAQQVPSLSCALNFDLGLSSLAIGGSAPRGHRDGHSEIRRWS